MPGQAAAPAKAPEKVSFNLTPRAAETLRRISEESHLSMTEVVRVSLGLMGVVWDELQSNNRLVIAAPDGTHLRDIILPLG